MLFSGYVKKRCSNAPVGKAGGGPDDTSDDVSDSEGEAGDAGKGPSRSARRKKLKRQLRRQGLLDTGLKQKSSQDRYTLSSAASLPQYCLHSPSICADFHLNTEEKKRLPCSTAASGIASNVFTMLPYREFGM